MIIVSVSSASACKVLHSVTEAIISLTAYLETISALRTMFTGSSQENLRAAFHSNTLDNWAIRGQKILILRLLRRYFFDEIALVCTFYGGDVNKKRILGQNVF